MKNVMLLVVSLVLTGCLEQAPNENAQGGNPKANDRASETPAADNGTITRQAGAAIVDGKRVIAHIISVDAGWGVMTVAGKNGSFYASILPDTGEYIARDLRYSDESCTVDPVSVATGVVGLVFPDRSGSRYYRVSSSQKRTIVARSRLTSAGCQLIPQTRTEIEPVEVYNKETKEYEVENQEVVYPVDTTVTGLTIEEFVRPIDFTHFAPIEIKVVE